MAWYEGTATLGKYSLTYKGTGSREVNSYVASLTPAYTFNWVKGFYGADRIFANDLKVDTKDSIFVGGSYYLKTLEIDGKSYSNRGSHDAFLVKMDHAGTTQWVKTLGGIHETVFWRVGARSKRGSDRQRVVQNKVTRRLQRHPGSRQSQNGPSL